MRVIGLTGGIGSGKSTVAKAFENLGVPVYIADDASKSILNSHPKAMQQVIALLGEEAYTFNDQGEPVANRSFIATKVFTNKKLLQGLNRILHPLVRIDFEDWLNNHDFIYCIYEAAILFESGGDQRCDATIVVHAHEQERIRRVINRDEVTAIQVKERLKNQWNDLQRLEKADFVIINEDIQSIPVYVDNIHQFMLKKEI